MFLTGRAALRCLADLPTGLCLPEDLAGQRETAMLLSQEGERTSSPSHRSSNLTFGVCRCICAQKKSSRTETVVLGAMQLKRLGRRG